MKKILTVLTITLAFFGTAKAIVLQKVILKDGSMLCGYTQKTQSGGTLVFNTDWAIICKDGKDVSKIENEKEYKLNEVDAGWANCPEALDDDGVNQTVTLCDVTLADGQEVMMVKLLEKGAKVRYIEMTPNSYNLSWDDVTTITADPREKGQRTGINRVYETASGETCEGQYAGETDGTLSLYTDDGVITTFNTDDVVRYTYKAVNPDQPLFEQSELLDIVENRAGETIEGIIVEQNYSSSKPGEYFVVVEKEDGSKKTILLSAVVAIERKPNSSYKPQEEAALLVGDVVVNNGDKAVFCKVEEDKNDEVLILVTPNLDNTVKAGEAFTVEYRVQKGQNADMFQLVQTQKISMNKSDLYCFTYKNLVNKLVRPSGPTQIRNGQDVKLVFTAYNRGVYALYDAQSKRAVPIVVE